MASVLKTARFVVATLVATLFVSAAPAMAAGEPTLSISMTRVELTTGMTSDVTFIFSSPPVGFSDADVNLSDANGTLTPVAPTADAKVYRATFTPNAGVADDTNTIVVGTQWTDEIGVAPLGPSSSANFTIATQSGGSGCPSHALALASPKGGESFAAGQEVDVFWQASGCQIASLQLTLSLDGGETYAVPVATVMLPSYGHYRWTVPDMGSTAARLKATLHGQGGVELASDVTDGNFFIAASTPPSPPESPPTVESPPASEPAPDGGGSGEEAPPVPPEPTSGASSTPDSPPSGGTATGEKPPVPPGPAPTTPILLPQQTSEAHLEPTTPMTTAEEQQTMTLENAQAVADATSGFMPEPAAMVLSFVLGAAAMLLAMLGAQKMARDARDKQGRTCKHCHGSGAEPVEETTSGNCGECGGTGKVEEEEEHAAECARCGGEGEEPCHVCEGEGADENGQPCAECGGDGRTMTEPEDGNEPEVAPCSECDGEGEVTTTIKKQVDCEECGGTGRA